MDDSPLECFLCKKLLRRGFLEFIFHPFYGKCYSAQVNFHVNDGVVSAILPICKDDYDMAVYKEDVFLALVKTRVEALLIAQDQKDQEDGTN